MADTTARFALPLLVAGQAQKEVSHNEALALVDGLLCPVAETMALSVPPSAPAAGSAWLVAAAPSGAWAGQAGRIALATEGGWRFATPAAGMLVWLLDIEIYARWTGSDWSAGTLPIAALVCGGVQVVGPQEPAIVAPAGGAVVDSEARMALSGVLRALRNHGLIAT